MRVENQKGGRQNTKRMGFPTTVRTVSEDSIVSSPFRQVWTAKNYAKLDSWDDGKRSNSMIGLGRMVPLTLFVQELEKHLIDQALERSGDNKRRAARLLGLKRTTLVAKLRRMNSLE